MSQAPVSPPTSAPKAEVPPATHPDLAGKVAVVTGASSAIGGAISRHLAAQGSKVALTGRRLTRLSHVLTEILPEAEDALAHPADCTDFSDLEALRAKVEDALGPADIVVAVAGGLGEPVPTEQITEPHWHAVVDANLTATFLTLKCFLPGMLARRRGAIVTMASTAGRVPGRASAAYAAAKAGVVMLTRHIAQEAGPHGVRINCISPSSIRTERLERLMPATDLARLEEQFPLRRIGTPDDVALATLFLVSDASAWLTGVTIDLTGGRVTT